MSLKKEKHSPKKPKMRDSRKMGAKEKEKHSKKGRGEDGLRPCFNLPLSIFNH